MDGDAASFFDDLSSPCLSLLDPHPPSHAAPPPNIPLSTPDIDLIAMTDPISDWDRVISHPLPPPPRSLPFPTPHPPNLHVAWMESTPTQTFPAPLDPFSHHPNPVPSPHPASRPHDDDEDSVDDTSPPAESLPDPKQPSKPASPTDIGIALKLASQNNQPSKPPQKNRPSFKSEPVVDPTRGNVSHTRRCRAKVNNNFERLLDALPPPPEGVEVKHKAQILAYAIDRFRVVRCHNMRLEMQLALSSPYQMQRWVHSVVSSATNLRDALKPFMALICLTKKWKYAELWAPYVKPGTSHSTALKYLTGALPPTVEGEELQRLRHYRSNSRKYVFEPRSGVPGRVFLTMRPEWLPLLNDAVAFPRAPHAVRHKVEVTFAVPVIVNGSVQMVVEFFDTKRRDYDPETMNMANDIAMLFGKAFTSQVGGFGGRGEI